MKTKNSFIRVLLHTASVALVVCYFIGITAGSVMAKSVYLIANHHTAQFDAWEQKPSGIIDHTATFGLQYATDPAGIAIWLDPKSDDAYLFITSEFSLAGVELVDADTMTSIGTASAASSNLAGIDIDDANLIVYAVERYSNILYVYDWDPSTLSLTPRPGSPCSLPNSSGIFGIAFDDSAGILWVADSASGWVRAYDVTNPTNPVENASLSFKPTHLPIDIAVDSNRGIVYSVSMSAGAWTPPGAGSKLLSKYELATKTETTDTLSCQGVGVAVDEYAGYVYLTLSPYCGGGGKVQAWDTSSTPWTMIDSKTVNGSPAGIAMGNVSAGNVLNLAKNDKIQGSVAIGEQFKYEITCDNFKNISHDATDVSILDTLPGELDFVSASHGGSYDPTTNTVLWDVGTILAGQAYPTIDLLVKVNQNAAPGTIINNYVTAEYTIAGEDGSTTVIDDEGSDDPNDEPGTLVSKDIPPVAICQDVTVAANPGTSSADASVDAGSYDPDGDAITAEQIPAGPYPIGTTVVELTVTNNEGLSSSCTASVTVTCPDGYNIVMGTEQSDSLGGTDGPDCIMGLGGDDYLYGLGGNDLIIGGPGNDYIEGHDGDDLIVCGDGNDMVFAGLGDDTIWGEDGNDNLYGDEGDDKVDGGDGDDQIEGNEGTDELVGGEGNDQITVGIGFGSVVHGGTGDDILDGGSFGSDVTIYGEEGNDIIFTGNGQETVYGGAGDDQIFAMGTHSTIWGGSGNDCIAVYSGTGECHGEAGDDEIWGGLGQDTISGGEGNDLLLGFDGDDTIFGGPGSDYIIGGEGIDTLSGDDCHDVIDSGQENDFSDGGNGIDACDGPNCEMPESAGFCCTTDNDCDAGQVCFVAVGLCMPEEMIDCASGQ